MNLNGIVIGSVVSVSDRPVRTTRTRKSKGNSLYHQVLTHVRALKPGQRLPLTLPSEMDWKKESGSLNALYRQDSDGRYAIGFRVHIERNEASREIVISNNDDGALSN